MGVGEEKSMFSRYWQVVQRALPTVLVLSAVAAAVAFFIVRNSGVTYQVHFSYLVSLGEREEADEYRFDGYYALQATDLFTATLAQWAKTPEVVVEAYKEAGLGLGSRDPHVITRGVRAVKTAPQLIEVTVRHKNEEAARSLADGLRVVVEREVAQYRDEGIPALRFRVVDTEPWVGIRAVSVPVVVIATFVFVFLISINLRLLVESLKQGDRKTYGV